MHQIKGILEHLNLSTCDNQGLNNDELNDSTIMHRNRLQEPVSWFSGWWTAYLWLHSPSSYLEQCNLRIDYVVECRINFEFLWLTNQRFECMTNIHSTKQTMFWRKQQICFCFWKISKTLFTKAKVSNLKA